MIIDPLLNNETNNEYEPYTAQCAIATGIGAALLSRVVAHLFVYRTDFYKEAANKYHAIINRQQDLMKQTPREELYGREASPAKTEFQANITQSYLLRKEVFRVSAHSTMTSKPV